MTTTWQDGPEPDRMRGSLANCVSWLRLEWRLVRAERTYWVALLLLGSMAALACSAGLSWSSQRKAIVAAHASREALHIDVMRSQLENPSKPALGRGKPLGQLDTLRVIADVPASLAYYGAAWSALLPPSPLAALSVGQADLWPLRYPTTAWSRRTNLEREEITNPLHLATGPFDPASLVVALLPLVLIALTHDLVSADRERGVLALMLSQPMPYAVVVLLKLLIRVALPVLLLMGVAGIGLLVGESGRVRPSVAAGFAAWVLVVLGYAAVWAGLAVAVNAWGGSSVANAVTLVALWVGTVVLVPAAVGKAAALAAPVPPRAELITRERQVREQAEKDGSRLVEHYYRDHPELERPDPRSDPYGQRRWDAIARKVDDEMQPAIDRYHGQIRRQLEFIGDWQVLSPALAVKRSLDDLAGTSVRHQVEFARRAAQHHERFMGVLYPIMMTREKLTLEQFDRIPAYSDAGLSAVWHPALVGKTLLVLVGWGAVALTVGLWRLRRPAVTG